jgi:3-hydroxyisobutyrate dehydrogenase-like beta-hydroxyacid dehydrogenase
MPASGETRAKGRLAGRKLGLVGLGLMGRPMGRNLLEAGADLTVFNRTRETAEAFLRENAGARIAATPAEAARAAEIVIVNVSDPPAVEAVLLGQSGIVEGLSAAAHGPTKIVIDMGTTALADTLRFAQRVKEAGGAYVDAPVSGGVVGAEAASLAIMVGGTDEAVARVRPVLERLGSRVTHVGGIGAGQVAKAANQMIVALTIGAVAEAFALARKAGIDPVRLREALMGGFAHSRILELHGQRMVEGRFAPGGRVTLQRKDVRQALDLAASLGIELPATELSLRLWDRMIEKGWGDLDHSALIKLYE